MLSHRHDQPDLIKYIYRYNSIAHVHIYQRNNLIDIQDLGIEIAFNANYYFTYKGTLGIIQRNTNTTNTENKENPEQDDTPCWDEDDLPEPVAQYSNQQLVRLQLCDVPLSWKPSSSKLPRFWSVSPVRLSSLLHIFEQDLRHLWETAEGCGQILAG